ncbi:hypothetical protein AB0442_28145 [Kitasatospora sp. NPDC085895]|uniref:hypothetical protein n=1 Tax=Kitasatospora sp. NPDC085895 TaxID=3155057 RepID=UPI003450E994
MSRPGRPPAPPDTRPGDPVRALMAEHRRLCEQAVDPLDIAAGLEDAGLSDGAAARYRHADLFALAEEMHARVERRPEPPAPAAPAAPWAPDAARALGTAALHLPAAGMLAAVPWLSQVVGPVAAVPAALLAVGWLTLAAPSTGPVARAGYGLGAGLLMAPAAAGGLGPAAVLALAAGAADLASRRLRDAARRHLASAPTLAEYRARMRPLLPVAAVVQLAVAGTAAAVLPLAADVPAAAGPVQALLAVLLLLAAVLLRSGRTVVAVAAPAAVGAVLALLAAAGPVPPPVVCVAATALLAPYTWLVLADPRTGCTESSGGPPED